MGQSYAILIVIIAFLSIILAAPSPKTGGGLIKNVGGAGKTKKTKQIPMVPAKQLIKLKDGNYLVSQLMVAANPKVAARMFSGGRSLGVGRSCGICSRLNSFPLIQRYPSIGYTSFRSSSSYYYSSSSSSYSSSGSGGKYYGPGGGCRYCGKRRRKRNSPDFNNFVKTLENKNRPPKLH